MEVTAEILTTEFCCVPRKEFNCTIFHLNEKAIVISFCDANEKVIEQSEIEKKEAIKLAKLILHHYE
jgi:hypothetical protein